MTDTNVQDSTVTPVDLPDITSPDELLGAMVLEAEIEEALEEGKVPADQVPQAEALETAIETKIEEALEGGVVDGNPGDDPYFD